MSKKPLILVADDDIAMRETVQGLLKTIDLESVAASNGKEALQLVESEKPDLLILDWTMPQMDGWEVCRNLRNNPKTRNLPVMMLTAKSTDEDEIICLEAGADDFVAKPFKSDLLLARVKALLRRYQDEAQNEIEANGIYINLEKHIVKVNNEEINIWPKEFDLLYFLMKKQGTVVSRDTLLECVWGYEYFGTTRTVDATMKRLREKLGFASDNIQTVKGVGYKFKS